MFSLSQKKQDSRDICERTTLSIQYILTHQKHTHTPKSPWQVFHTFQIGKTKKQKEPGKESKCALFLALLFFFFVTKRIK